ncbi:MAG: PAS domain-containing protein [Desulfomonilaceae bacterium]
MQDHEKCHDQVIKANSKMDQITTDITAVRPDLSGFGTMTLELAPKDVLRWVILVCGTITAVIGLLFFVGWELDWGMLTGERTNFIPMAPNTALLFILSGIALVVGGLWPANRIIRTSMSVAGLLTLISGGTYLIGSVFGFDLEISHWFLSPPETLGAVPIGYMSPITSFSFIVSGAALFLLGRQCRDQIGVMGTLVVFVGWVNVTGYWYGAPLLYGGTVIPVALPTSLAFTLLGVGLMAAAGSQAWPLSILSGPSTRARLLRGLIPPILAIMLIEGWLNTLMLGKSDTIAVLESAAIGIVTVLLVFLVVSTLSRVIGDRIDKAEEALRESEERFSKAFRLNPDPMTINTLADGVIVSASRGFCQTFGYTEKEVIGKSPLELKIWDDLEDRNRFVEKVKTEGKVDNIEYRMRNQRGDLIYGLLSGSIIHLNGSPHALIVAKDITDRKRAEENTLASEQRLKAITNSAFDAIILINDRGEISYWNPASERIFGYSDSEVMGKDLHELLVPPEFHTAYRSAFKDFVASGRGNALGKITPLVARRKGGEEFPIELSLSGFQADGRWQAAGIVRDITDRKLLEEEKSNLIIDLQKALSEVKKLSGVLPICASCKKIRDDTGYWNEIERYIGEHSEAQFSHGICPDCMRKLYPEYADEILSRRESDAEK